MGVIYILSELIVNAVDNIAKEFNIPDTFSSSVIAALATTLPEFLVPLISFLRGGNDFKDIGTGSIFGGPIVLSTFGFVFMLLIVEAKYRRFKDLYDITNILFFLLNFSLLVFASFYGSPKVFIPIIIFIYVLFIYKQAKTKNENASEEHHELFFAKFIFKKQKKILAFAQGIFVVVSLYFVIKALVVNIEDISQVLGWAPVKSALLFSPFATELPELFNAFIWARAGKIRLSIGNIAGSLAFQASLPASLGLWFTDWHLSNEFMVVWFFSIISTITFSLSISKATNIRMGIIAIFVITMLYFIYIFSL